MDGGFKISELSPDACGMCRTIAVTAAAEIPAVFINLDRNADRRAFVERELSRANLKAERWPAVDGRQIPDWAAPYFPPSHLTPGEVGCYASHLSIMRRIVAEGLDYCLVLEDDVAVDPDAALIVEETLSKLPEGWDLVHMACNARSHPYAFRPLSPLSNKRQLVRYSRVPTSTAALLFSQSGARKFLRLRPRCVPIDHDTRRPWLWDLDVYGVEKGPFRPGTIGSVINAMGGPAVRGHSRLRRGIYGGVMRTHRTLRSAIFNIRKLGFNWWLWCLAQNAFHKALRTTIGSGPALRLHARLHRERPDESTSLPHTSGR